MSVPKRAALRVLVVLVPLVSLLMLGRLVADWRAIAQVTGETPAASAPRGFDWVQWQDRDGEIVAAYVYPGGTAYAAGLREEAVLYQFEFQQFFSAEDLKRAVEGVAPGDMLVYDVVQDDQLQSFEIPISRYPTFLYPLGGMLWQASLWGFALAAFLHLLGLTIVAPLVGRSRRSWRSFALFAAASLWVFGNLVRLLSLTLAGPPMGGGYAAFFQAVTLLALGGWVLFPALLLHHVLADVMRLRAVVLAAVYLPAAVLGSAVAGAVIWGSVGPLTLDALIAPILFYVCCYVAAATGLSLASPRPDETPEGDAVPASTAWSRAGSAAVFALAVLGALSVYGIVPLPGAVSDAGVGGLIVLIQLLSLAPVGLASVATLRYGRADAVVTRALVYVLLFGAAFFVVVGGLLLVERVLPSGLGAWPRSVVAGVYVVLLMLLAERGARVLRRYVARWFVTERQRARAQIRAFSERLRHVLDAHRLAQETVQTVGAALGARSGVLFLRDPAGDDAWVRATYHPDPPYFTEAELRQVWDRLQQAGTVWARNAELDESDLSPEENRLLQTHGVALAVPVAGGETEPAGLLVLGRKARRRAVYNLEDVAMLRSLGGQLALAVERLALVEREKALVRQSAEAQLAALRAQINPHFLFNTLNTIAALIDQDPREAEGTVERLASIFRTILQTGSRPFVPLADEARLVEDYLAIEQARFGPALRIERAWDPALRDLPVPAFAVQTLVENAVKHGIERKRGGGTLTLASRHRGDCAEVCVTDTGLGIPALFSGGDGVADVAHPASFFGIGLRNVAARMEQLYGRTDLLRFASAPDTGTEVKLLIPLAETRPV
ncbi:MAG: histidine kinase [Bacteroidota bacterium]